MESILNGGRFCEVAAINKGWSGDKKFCVKDAEGGKYFLRISPIERSGQRRALFKMLEGVRALGVPMSSVLEYGVCAEGFYWLETWIEGEDMETTLSQIPKHMQYELGRQSGEMLKKIHSVPAPDNQANWASRFNDKIDNKISKYRECGLRFEDDGFILKYIHDNRHLLDDRPQCFQHGDYHIGNMMYESGVLRIIDFDRYDFGDPWEEFNRIVWTAPYPHFATGQLHGYFGGEPPADFFKLLALYISSNTLSSIYWAIPFGQAEIDTMMNQTKDVLSWFDNMKNPVPSWYLKSIK